MTTKQKINYYKKQKDVEGMINAYNLYYKEQSEKPVHERIKEIDAMPEYMRLVVLVNFLRRKLLGINRKDVNKILIYYFKRQRSYSYYQKPAKKYDARELLGMRKEKPQFNHAF